VASNGSSTLSRPLGLWPSSPTVARSVALLANPLALEPRAGLDVATWARVFDEAVALGVLQVHLSGGEPAARRDLVYITTAARVAGLYTNLITSGIGLTAKRLAELKAAGLDHVQVSIQDSDAKSADHIAGYDGAFTRKCELANEVVRLEAALTVNAVMHRAISSASARW
jgi:pyrroloquinoline quinone biosynthesis protein E